MSPLRELLQDLENLKNPKKAKTLSGFFKTGNGQYGEGDVFLGISVPDQRAAAKKHLSLNFQELNSLLKSKIHEHRLTALLILAEKYRKSGMDTKKKILDFYFKNMKYVNNWDLVDSTADKIVGSYLADKNKSVLYRLTKSKNVWERRISIISTFYFIRNNKFGDTLRISELLLHDRHDLIHKAVGWMLREIGKRDQYAEERFLRKHCKEMPRTMLRYAIERFDEKKRMSYLKIK